LERESQERGGEQKRSQFYDKGNGYKEKGGKPRGVNKTPNHDLHTTSGKTMDVKASMRDAKKKVRPSKNKKKEGKKPTLWVEGKGLQERVRTS